MSAKQTEIILIKPFRSRIAKQPVTPGDRRVAGVLINKLDNLGFANQLDDALMARRAELEHQLKWNVAHKRFEALIPCISVNDDYDKPGQGLPYTIDLYGDGQVTKEGRLYVSYSDFELLYSKLSRARCKESLVSRIALANVGMMVPYVTLQDVLIDEDGVKVEAPYEIVL